MPSRQLRNDRQQVMLVLQGGGAMGAYQAGVYRAMQEAGIEPDWVVGSAFGTINAGLIVGNPPEVRRRQLDEFWDWVRDRSPFDKWSIERLKVPDYGSVVAGVSGFFRPNLHAALGLGASAGIDRLSLYRMDVLNDAFYRRIDFDRLNRGEPRLTLSAVNVRSGNYVAFDSSQSRITPEHLMASLAMPPYFPAVAIDGEHYWSGELYSSVGLELAFGRERTQSTLVVSVASVIERQAPPQTLAAVIQRQQRLRESSGHRLAVDHRFREQQLRAACGQMAAMLTTQQMAMPAVKKALAAIGRDSGKIELLSLSPQSAETSEEIDYVAFTADAIEAMREQGWRHAQAALTGRDSRKRPPASSRA